MSLFEIVPQNIFPIQILPQDIFFFLLSFLSKQDRVNCKFVSKAFRRGIRKSCKSLRIILCRYFYLFKSGNVSLQALSKFVNLEKLDIRFTNRRSEKDDHSEETTPLIQNVPILSRLKTLKTEVELDCSKFPQLEKLSLWMQSARLDRMGLSNICKLKKLNLAFPFQNLDQAFPKLKLIEKLEFNRLSNTNASEERDSLFPFSSEIKILHFNVWEVPLSFDAKFKDTLPGLKSFSIQTWNDYHVRGSNFGEFFSNKNDMESIYFSNEYEREVEDDGFEKNGRLKFDRELAERLPNLKKLQTPFFNFAAEKHQRSDPFPCDKYFELDYFRELQILSLYNVGDANFKSQLRYLPNLRKLCTGANYFNKDSFENALNLEVLIVGGPLLEDEHFQNGNFPKLKILRFLGCNFPLENSDGPVLSNEMFSKQNFPNLEYFFLDRSDDISDLNYLLDKCPKLKGLSVSDNSKILDEKNQENFDNRNSKLKYLIINSFTDRQAKISSSFLKKISKTIEYLSIHIDDIDFPLYDLLECEKLKGIYVRGIDWNKKDKERYCYCPMNEPYMCDIFQEEKVFKKKREPLSRKEIKNIVMQIYQFEIDNEVKKMNEKTNLILENVSANDYEFRGEIDEIDEIEKEIEEEGEIEENEENEIEKKERDEKRKLDWEGEEEKEEKDEEENDNRKKQKK